MVCEFDSRSRGQALVECTMIAAFLLFLVLGAVAISEQLRTQMKHHFIPNESSHQDPDLLANQPDLLHGKSLEAWENNGWNQDHVARLPGGTITSLHRGDKKVLLLRHDGQQLGVSN